MAWGFRYGDHPIRHTAPFWVTRTKELASSQSARLVVTEAIVYQMAYSTAEPTRADRTAVGAILLPYAAI